MLRGGTPAASITVAEPNEAVGRQLATDFGVSVFVDGVDAARSAESSCSRSSHRSCARSANIWRPRWPARRPLIISIAAGLRIDQIDGWLGGGFPIVRCMPNTPSLIGAGASGLFANAAVSRCAAPSWRKPYWPAPV